MKFLGAVTLTGMLFYIKTKSEGLWCSDSLSACGITLLYSSCPFIFITAHIAQVLFTDSINCLLYILYIYYNMYI